MPNIAAEVPSGNSLLLQRVGPVITIKQAREMKTLYQPGWSQD